MNIIIREYRHYNKSEILPLYQSVGWKAYTDAPDVLARAFSHSTIALAAYSGEELVGMLRAVGDGETILFIQDLLIHPDFQRKGVGSALVKEFLARYAHVRQIQLTADSDPVLIAFYQALGFRPVSDFGCTSFWKA